MSTTQSTREQEDTSSTWSSRAARAPCAVRTGERTVQAAAAEAVIEMADCRTTVARAWRSWSAVCLECLAGRPAGQGNNNAGELHSRALHREALDERRGSGAVEVWWGRASNFLRGTRHMQRARRRRHRGR